jgi:hypothetical protein
MRRAGFVMVYVGFCLMWPAANALAQTPEALRQEIEQLRRDFEATQKQYGERLAALETKLEAAAPAPAPPATPPPATLATPVPGPAQTAQIPAGAEGAGGPTGTLPVYGGAAQGSKIFNPDIAVIGEFLSTAGRNTVNPSPAMQLPETEASFQAVVDPYARADFFFAYGQEGVEVEEGFITFPAIPGGLLVKVGKTRAAFGKVNTFHTHVLSWADRPLVTDNLLGGDEGINNAGVSVARLIPNPWLFLEGTGQVYRGNSSDVFFAPKPGDLLYVGHLRAYQDVNEATNVDFGVSYARGHNASGIVDGVDFGRFVTGIWGIDATVRWKPLQRSIYKSFLARSEVMWSRREQPGGPQNSHGFYVSGDYQLARRWIAGVRYDWSQIANDSALRDDGESFVVTYRPSEFSQIRGQYRRTNYALGETANEVLFQLQFAIGAHGAHPF